MHLYVVITNIPVYMSNQNILSFTMVIELTQKVKHYSNTEGVTIYMPQYPS